MTHQDRNFKNGGFVNDQEEAQWLSDVVLKMPVSEVKQLMKQNPAYVKALIKKERL